MSFGDLFRRYIVCPQNCQHEVFFYYGKKHLGPSKALDQVLQQRWNFTDFQADLNYNWEFTFRKQHSHLLKWLTSLQKRPWTQNLCEATSGKEQWHRASKYNSVSKPGDIFSEHQIWHGDFPITIHMHQFPQFLRTRTINTAINNLPRTEFAALVLNSGLEPFLQEKPFITAHFPSSPPPGSNNSHDFSHSFGLLPWCLWRQLKKEVPQGNSAVFNNFQQFHG